jgi:hypothetical protein
MRSVAIRLRQASILRDTEYMDENILCGEGRGDRACGKERHESFPHALIIVVTTGVARTKKQMSTVWVAIVLGRLAP